jgi:hypothetical protein
MKKARTKASYPFHMLMLLVLNAFTFDSSEPLLGFPIVYIYIFSAWFSIAISFLIINKYYE